MSNTRKALVFGGSERTVAAYLPSNYRVVGATAHFDRPAILIEGEDAAGWTLDGYVIPRLQSGMLGTSEVIIEEPS